MVKVLHKKIAIGSMPVVAKQQNVRSRGSVGTDSKAKEELYTDMKNGRFTSPCPFTISFPISE